MPSWSIFKRADAPIRVEYAALELELVKEQYRADSPGYKLAGYGASGRAMAILARENATTTTELTAETFRELQRKIAEPGGPVKIAAMPVAPAYRCNYHMPVKAKVRAWVVASKQLNLDAECRDTHRVNPCVTNRLARQQYDDGQQALMTEARQAAIAKFKRTERAYPVCSCGKSVELIFKATAPYQEQGYFVCVEQWAVVRRYHQIASGI